MGNSPGCDFLQGESFWVAGSVIAHNKDEPTLFSPGDQLYPSLFYGMGHQ